MSDKCVYCGKKLTDDYKKFIAIENEYKVCSDECCDKTTKYINNDKKFKTLSYFMILIGGVCFMLSALFANISMDIAYIGQTVTGISLFFFPYVIISFKTFETTPIKSVNFITRLVGLFFTLFGVYLLII